MISQARQAAVMQNNPDLQAKMQAANAAYDDEPLIDTHTAFLAASLRQKDDIIQAQYAEIVELRRQLELATEGVKHWMRLAHESA